MSIQEPNSYYTQGFGTAYQKVEIPVISSRDPTIYDGVAPHSMPLGKRWINSPTGSTWELTSVYSVNGEMRAAWSQTSGGSQASVYPITSFAVGPIGQAGYQTIQSAIDAAHAAGGGAVYIQPGTYTEDLTMYSDAISLIGTMGVQEEAYSVVIAGKITLPTDGTASFTNLSFTDPGGNGYIFIGPTPCHAEIIVTNCTSSLGDNGWTFNLGSFDGTLFVDGLVTGDGSAEGVFILGSPMGGYYTAFVQNCNFKVGGYGASIGGQGYFYLYNSTIGMSFPVYGSVRLNAVNCQFSSLYLNGDSTAQVFDCNFSSGGNASVWYDTSASSTFSNCTFNSTVSPGYVIDTNTTPGILNLAVCSFLGTNSTISPTIGIHAFPNILGDTTISNGNLSLDTDSATISLFNGGTANSAIGVSRQMTTGNVNVPCTVVTANSYIWVQTHELHTQLTPSALYVSHITPGASFDVVSENASDDSTVQYWVMNTVQP